MNEGYCILSLKMVFCVLMAFRGAGSYLPPPPNKFLRKGQGLKIQPLAAAGRLQNFLHFLHVSS